MSEIPRGADHELEFELDLDLTEVQIVWVTFSQNGFKRFRKETEDLEPVDIHTLKVHLTQEDTILLKPKRKVSIQIKFMNTDGTVDVTEIIRRDVSELLDEDIIGEEPTDEEQDNENT